MTEYKVYICAYSVIKCAKNLHCTAIVKTVSEEHARILFMNFLYSQMKQEDISFDKTNEENGIRITEYVLPMYILSTNIQITYL